MQWEQSAAEHTALLPFPPPGHLGLGRGGCFMLNRKIYRNYKMLRLTLCPPERSVSGYRLPSLEPEKGAQRRCRIRFPPRVHIKVKARFCFVFKYLNRFSCFLLFFSQPTNIHLKSQERPPSTIRQIAENKPTVTQRDTYGQFRITN